MSINKFTSYQYFINLIFSSFFTYIFFCKLSCAFLSRLFYVRKDIFKNIFITESFNMNISHCSFFNTNNLCKFTTLKHKFKRWFCQQQKTVLIVSFKDFWYKKICLRFGMTNAIKAFKVKNFLHTQQKILTFNNY